MRENDKGPPKPDSGLQTHAQVACRVNSRALFIPLSGVDDLPPPSPRDVSTAPAEIPFGNKVRWIKT